MLLHHLRSQSGSLCRYRAPDSQNVSTHRGQLAVLLSPPPSSSRCCPEIHAGGLIMNRLSADVLWPDWRFTGCEWWNSVPLSPSRTGLNHYANSCRAGWCHGSGWEREWDSTFSFQTSEVMWWIWTCRHDVRPLECRSEAQKTQRCSVYCGRSFWAFYFHFGVNMSFFSLSTCQYVDVFLYKHDIQLKLCWGKASVSTWSRIVFV